MEDFIWYLLSHTDSPQSSAIVGTMLFFPEIIVGCAMSFSFIVMWGLLLWGKSREKTSDKSVLRCLLLGVFLQVVAFVWFYYVGGSAWMFSFEPRGDWTGENFHESRLIYAFIMSTPFFVTGCCIPYAVAALRKSRRFGTGYLAVVMALAHIVLFPVTPVFTMHVQKVYKVLNGVRGMTPPQYEEFLQGFSGRAKKHVFGATFDHFLNLRHWEEGVSLAETFHRIAQTPELENANALALIASHYRFDADAQTLALLAQSSNERVLNAVASNPNTPVEILRKLNQRKEESLKKTKSISPTLSEPDEGAAVAAEVEMPNLLWLPPLIFAFIAGIGYLFYRAAND